MSATLNRRVLVLNKNWTPVGTVTVQRAIIMLFSEYDDGVPKAKVIEPESYATFTWSDWSKLKPLATDEKLAAANMYFKVPEVILLSRYEKLPKPKVNFSRRTLLKRDNQKCQYCGCHPKNDEWSIDHVTPRSKGGLTTWENCVLSCNKCNRFKADKTLEECGLKLLKQPKKPDFKLFRFDTLKPIKSWAAFISDAYFNVELENDNK